MTLNQIAFASLKKRKAKALFILMGLLVGVSSVVAFVSLVNALTDDINHKLEQYGANILIAPKTENLSLTYGGMSIGGISFEIQDLYEKELAGIKTIKNAGNVAAVGAFALGAVELEGQKVLLAGMNFSARSFLRPWWRIQGEDPGPDGLLLGSEAARILGLSVGDRVAIRGQDFIVSGILHPTGSQDDQILFTPLKTAQKVLGMEGKISMAEVAALCSGCPIDEMVAQISPVLPNAKVMAVSQVVKSRMEALGHFKKLAYGLGAMVVLAGGLVVLVTMMGGVRERTAEFGIFRAIGFKSRHLIRIVLLEAAVLSAAAGILGYFLGWAASWASTGLFTDSKTVAVPFDPALFGGMIAMSMILGLVAAAYPAWTASRLDPSQALRTL